MPRQGQAAQLSPVRLDRDAASPHGLRGEADRIADQPEIRHVQIPELVVAAEAQEDEAVAVPARGGVASILSAGRRATAGARVGARAFLPEDVVGADETIAVEPAVRRRVVGREDKTGHGSVRDEERQSTE